ncbi:MAG: hypothetical protein ACTTHY_08015, partial [Prevotella intermedia]
YSTPTTFKTTFLYRTHVKKVGWNDQPTKCPLLKHERFSAYQMSITPKSIGFTSQKSRFRNAKAQVPFFNRIIFTKLQLFFNDDIQQQQGNGFSNTLLLYRKNVWIQSPKKAYACSRIHRPCHLTK